VLHLSKNNNERAHTRSTSCKRRLQATWAERIVRRLLGERLTTYLVGHFQCDVISKGIIDISTGEEITPKLKLTLKRSLATETPPGSPGTNDAMPITPVKPTSTNVFGLLTPCTPSFSGFSSRSPKSPTVVRNRRVSNIVEEDDSEVDEPLRTSFDELQQQIKDAELAASLAQDGTTTGQRRSTRIAKNDTVKGKLLNTCDKPIICNANSGILVPIDTIRAPTKYAKTAQQAIAVGNVAPPESSLAAEAIIILPPDYNPIPLTLDWQLQYPPGGGTHPSYAYPQLDPRLFFNPACVPIYNGLPSVFRVPALVLPMGWSHVSWSGLLPIVFDPNHQGFKLTPIGPLPLTCEEVQQGGLGKYVPGGAEHPEAGMLPDATILSDGSEVVYNFEEIDWVLPWPQYENFDGTCPIQHGNGLPSPVTDSGMTSARVASAAIHHIEARDCPDSIVDINDAWRWISEKCDASFTKFEPTPGKSWKYTGIHRIGRKQKQPIASLLASALAETIASPGNIIATYLINQNTREFCPFKSVATPFHVNIVLLGDTELTLKELLCYFPSHYMWRKAGDRLVRSGMANADIANMINMTRKLPGETSLKSNSVMNAIMYEKAQDGSGVKVKIIRDYSNEQAQSYTAEGWTWDLDEVIDYPILALAHGLFALPEGSDAGPLTTLIKHCKEQCKHKVMLSEVPEMLQEVGISSLIEPSELGCPDKEVLGRHVELLKRDRLRVLREMKSVVEKEGGNKRKRMKVE
jgi:hypothetical protein